MIVIDPAKVSLPWVLVVSTGAIVSALLLSRGMQPNARESGKFPSKPRTIHSLPTTKPILGDLLEVIQNASVRHDWLTAQSSRFNFEPWQIKILGSPVMVVVADPSIVEEVTTSQFDNFIKGPSHLYLLHDVFGDGIINSDGEQWYHQRKTAAKFFTAKTLRLMMMHTMKRSMEQMNELLDAHSHGDDFVNLSLLFHRFTLQTFLEVGVGVEFPLIGRADELPFEKAMDESIEHVVRRRLLPPFVWKLQRWLNLGQERLIRESTTIIRNEIGMLVQQSLRSGASSISPVHGGSTIHSAVELFAQHSNDEKSGLHADNLVDFVINFVLAARDTSSVAMSWLFFALGKHPDVEDKLRKELFSKLPPPVDGDSYITADQVKPLVYLEATIKETLRLYPAVPFFVRQAACDTIIGGDLFIRKDQRVAFSSYVMARNPKLWGPDAAEFKPERWIDQSSGELLSVSSTKFVAFSAGPRNCIGMNLAMLSLRVMIANLLRRYKFAIDPENDGSYVNAVTLFMKKPLLARVEAL